MFFPNAFEKVFLATAGVAAAGKAGNNTTDLASGEIALVDASNYQILDTVTNTTNAVYKNIPMVILAQGSMHTKDLLGAHGGYQASVKSKGINPKYVSAFFVSEPSAAVTGVYNVKPIAPATELAWDTTYRFRIDLKGSPVLRFLGRNAYHTFDVFTGCDPGDSSAVDHATVIEALAAQINDQPIMSEYIQATVEYVTYTNPSTEATRSAAKTAYDAEADASLKSAELILTTAFVDTKFGDASFSVQDHHEIAPVELYASVVDESGNPCESLKFAVSTTTQPKQGSGYGETLIRDLILSKRYEQEDFCENPRKREILDDASLGSLNRNNKYYVYTVLHSVPRKANPSGVFDNDQYALRIVTSARIASFEAWMNAYLSDANNAVQLEVK